MNSIKDGSTGKSWCLEVRKGRYCSWGLR